MDEGMWEVDSEVNSEVNSEVILRSLSEVNLRLI